MKPFVALAGGAFALSALLGLAPTSPAVSSTSYRQRPIAHASSPAPSAVPAISVTERDVAASNEKARLAYGDLVTMWTETFAQLGVRFVRPALARYREPIETSCGVMGPGNAGYCPRDNAIYFDEVFLAVQAKRAARALGTDGDMAAVGVIAHEMGHAVVAQLGRTSRIPYENEATADCLAGAFAERAGRTGSLEKGDVDEAFYAMSTAGDPPPPVTGIERVDRRIVLRAALLGHGTYAQRMQNFRTGLDGGAPACLPEVLQHS